MRILQLETEVSMAARHGYLPQGKRRSPQLFMHQGAISPAVLQCTLTDAGQPDLLHECSRELPAVHCSVDHRSVDHETSWSNELGEVAEKMKRGV